MKKSPQKRIMAIQKSRKFVYLMPSPPGMKIEDFKLEFGWLGSTDGLDMMVISGWLEL